MLSVLAEAGVGEGVRPWFALRVRSNCERMTSTHLRERGYEEFAPSYKVDSQWSDRKKIIERFLFPSYVFCRLDLHDRVQVLTAPGAVNFVGFGSGPTPVPDTEIETIRRMVQSGLLVTPSPFLALGQRVRLERGPLTGVEGILQQIKGATRLVVSIEILQRSVSTEVNRTWVLPLKDSVAPGSAPHANNEAKVRIAKASIS
jgi:transcription antitermination factor NusG